jgi:pimeloyl-ACP methyl ester carboxylesterase
VRQPVAGAPFMTGRGTSPSLSFSRWPPAHAAAQAARQAAGAATLMAAALLGWTSALPACAAELTPCRLRGVEHGVLCGSVERALDPANPGGVRIEVHYAVLPALARNKRPDPVFFFAGGPGQSAIEIAPAVASLLGRFSNRRDIVLIDQRGTGRSAPLACDDDDPAQPLSEQFSTARQAERLLQCLARLKTLPHGDLRFYGTSIAMADADAVRQAIGAERINVVGASYGTRAALEYQRQFPLRVRRVVLDGVAAPDMVLPTALSIDNQAALDKLFDACDREPACSARRPGLAERWRTLLASLPRQASLVHPVSGRAESLEVTRDAVLAMVRGPLYAPSLAAALPAAIDEARDGRFGPLAGLASAFGGSARRGLRLAAGMHFAVVCAEDYPGMATSTDRPAADFGAAFADIYRDVCSTLQPGSVPPAFYRLGVAQAATLLLSGGVDPVTPPRHAERVARALGTKARHIVVANAGHGLMNLGCLRDAVFRFVDAATEEEALQVDANCAATIPRPPMFRPPWVASGAAGP